MVRMEVMVISASVYTLNIGIKLIGTTRRRLVLERVNLKMKAALDENLGVRR